MNYTIKQISAKETWKLRQAVMWPDKPISFVKLPNDDTGWHFGLFVDDKLVSVISLFDDSEDSAQFRKFCTAIEFQNRGLGSILLSHLINEAKKMKFKTLSCDARVSAIPFYERFEMKTEGDPFVKYGKDYIKMSYRPWSVSS